MEKYIEEIKKICKIRGYEIFPASSMTRCINTSTGEMLLAYTKNSKTIKIYLDTINDLRNERPISNEIRNFRINDVITPRNNYYSNQITIKNDEDYECFLDVMYYIIGNNIPLRVFKAPKNSLSQRTQRIVERAVTLTRELKYGIELELIVPSKEELKRKLIENGITVKDPLRTHDMVAGWKLVHDGSINARGNNEGVELVSPPMTNFEELKIVCKVLKEVGARFNDTCGLHVHHDINNLKRKQIMRIYNFYNKYEKAIYAMMPVARRKNRFCKSVSEIINKVNQCRTKEELLKNVAGKGIRAYYNSCRYYAINLRSFLYYGTIEFRQGFATRDFNTIKSWVLFTHKIIERGLQIGNDVKYNLENDNIEYIFNEMIKEIDIENTDTSKNLKKRFDKYRRRVA